MRKIRIQKAASASLLAALTAAAMLAGCQSQSGAQTTTDVATSAQAMQGAMVTESVVTGVAETTEAGTAAPVDASKFYGYSDEDFSMPVDIDQHFDGIDYGTLHSDMTYYSTTAGAQKQCSVLVPAGYSETEQYPVIYFLHGFGGEHSVWFGGPDQLRNTYGNMIASGDAVPAIVVTVDMYTDPMETYEATDNAQKRASYDKFGNDLVNDLMPFIAANFSVKEGPAYTAILGESQGATESLAIGFMHQDKIGYIAALAPCPGVIPTEFNKGTFWNIPLMEDFVIEDPANPPYYVMLAVGETDPYCKDSTIYYDYVMTDKGIVHDSYILPVAGHDADLWQNGIYNFAKRTFRDVQ